MKDKLTSLLKAGYAGIYIPSPEAQRVEGEVAAAAKNAGFAFYTWTCTRGAYQIKPAKGNKPAEAISLTTEQDKEMMVPPHYAALDKFDALPKTDKAVFLMHGFSMFLTQPDPMLFQRIKDSLLAGKMCNHTLIICGPTLVLPPELEKDITVLEFKLPDAEQINTVLDGICASAKIELNGERDALVDACSGGTTTEIENWLALAVVESGGKHIDARVVETEKSITLKKAGLLEVIKTGITFADIGGLDELKLWIRRRKRAFSKEAEAYHLPRPKGVCLYGVSGCGKSFATNAIANELGVPHLRLDAGKLFGSLVGQSEATVRAVIAQVEAFGKCVLQIEELDKSFAGMKNAHDGDSGVTRRVVGSFLTWMQEKASPAFIVATANDMTKLPPELLRKGRWDELWFFDLPTESERVEIWRTQIKRNHRKPSKFNLEVLAKSTEGWTGAEIEALVKESLYAAFDEDKEPDTDLLKTLATSTSPMSKIMATETEAIRRWSIGKARLASSQHVAVAASKPEAA